MPNELDLDLMRKVEAAVSNLPPNERAIFLAIRCHDMSYAEIARRTGLTPQGVERYFARALYKLMKQAEGRKLSWWERRF